MEEHHTRLRAELTAQGIELRMTPHVLFDDRDTGAGLLDSLTVTVARRAQEPLDIIGTLFRPLPERHARHGRTTGTGLFAVPVRSRDEAQAEADLYDPIPVFARYLLRLWRGSMPPWAYYPTEASASPHASYGHYRMEMMGQVYGARIADLGGVSDADQAVAIAR